MLWAEAAHGLGLVPLLVAVWLALPGRTPSAALWWMAFAFGVSFLADSLAHWVNPWVLSTLYPVGQASIIGMVLLPRKQADQMVTTLLLVGGAALVWSGTAGPDVLVTTVASLSVCCIVWPRRELGLVRSALLVTFGLGLVAWYVHVVWLVVPTWYPYQACRLVGTALLCAAMFREP